MTVVLDASAILAFVHDEDGARVVEEVLVGGAHCSAANCGFSGRLSPFSWYGGKQPRRFPGPDPDPARGGLGGDAVYGGLGDDTVDGGNGNDYLNGGGSETDSCRRGETVARCKT